MINYLLQYRTQWIATLALATLVAFIISWEMQSNGLRLSSAFYLAFPGAGALLALCVSSHFLSRATPFNESQFIWLYLLRCCATLVISGGWSYAYISWRDISLNLDDLTAQKQWVIFCFAAVTYFLYLLTLDLKHALSQLTSTTQRQMAHELWAQSAELRALRAQINPHFLFNSLNSISALTLIDPAAAQEMTISLAQFFRLTLAYTDQKTISLREEVTLCENYWSIEQRRFGDKIQLNLSIDASAADAQIPPLILQPLLENAIKHGVSRRTTGGEVSIQIQHRHGRIYIRVTNPVAASTTTTEKIGTGTGLKNLQARLQALFDKDAICEWRHEGELFIVDITLPWLTTHEKAQ